MYLHSHCPKGLLIVFCFDPGVLLQDFIGLGRAGSLELGGQAHVRDGQDLNGQQGRDGCPVDGDRGQPFSWAVRENSAACTGVRWAE